MGYMHVQNLYRPEAKCLLLFREVYALEKIHGTSAHLRWNAGTITYFAGGESHPKFCALFDDAALKALFAALGHDDVTVYGEAYGGKQQGMAHRYGPTLRFVAFEVQVGESWLNVPHAEAVVQGLGLEFVHYRKVSTDLADLDAERDAPSEQARRNGVGGDQPREGVVLRPLQEFRDGRGDRVMAKHKRDDERETKTPRKVNDPEAAKVLADAQAIADEWVTDMRLTHVLQRFPEGTSIEATRDVINAMVEDVEREGAGEIVPSREARQAIGKVCAKMFKARISAALRNGTP